MRERESEGRTAPRPRRSIHALLRTSINENDDANPTSAEKSEARLSRQASRGSGAVNAKDDGLNEAARAATGSAAATAKSKRRVAQTSSSSEEDDDLETAGVVNVSLIGKAKSKIAAHQQVHAFMFDCNTCLTHNSIFFAGNIEVLQRSPVSPAHFARAYAQGASKAPDTPSKDTGRNKDVSPSSQSPSSQSQLSQV